MEQKNQKKRVKGMGQAERAKFYPDHEGGMKLPEQCNRKTILRWWAKRERLEEEKEKKDNRSVRPQHQRPLEEYPYVYRKYRLPTVLSRHIPPYSGKELKGDDRRTLPVMSKFDVYRILRGRLKQLWEGAPHHPDCPPHVTRLPQITEWELFTGKLEGEIIRKHPNGDYERWAISELSLPTTHAH